MAGASTPTHRIKLILAGDPGVGKSMYRLRLQENPAIQTMPTVGIDFAVFNIHSTDGGQFIQVWLNDVAGSSKFDTVAQSYLRKTNGVICIFDITDRASMYSLRDHWLPVIEKANADIISEAAAYDANLGNGARKARAIEYIIMGNKNDLTKERAVSYEEATGFVRSVFGDAPYVELSCIDTRPESALLFITPRNWLIDRIMDNEFLVRHVAANPNQNRAEYGERGTCVTRCDTCGKHGSFFFLPEGNFYILPSFVAIVLLGCVRDIILNTT